MVSTELGSAVTTLRTSLSFMRSIFCIILLTILFSLCRCSIFGGPSEIARAERYELKVPESWSPSPNDGESDRTYKLPSKNLVTVTSSCNRSLDTSLEVMTKHLLIGARNIRIQAQEKLIVDGSEGLFSKVSATLEGRSFELNLFVLPKKPCLFDFSLVSPKSVSAEESIAFLNFIKSFKYGTN